MSAARLDRCNRAIAKLPANPIASFDENSLEARECRRFYPGVVERMLEAYDWSFANRRTRLAALATNDRDYEWLHAYALPADMATPIRVIPDLSALGIGVPVPLLGQPYAERWGYYAPLYEQPYIIEGETLYSNTADAFLEYGVNSIDNLRLPKLVDEAIVAQLAAEICIPVKKDTKREQFLLGLADHAWQRALADDQNRHPRWSPDYMSEALLARAGAA